MRTLILSALAWIIAPLRGLKELPKEDDDPWVW
jgi:hypothetical protein